MLRLRLFCAAFISAALIAAACDGSGEHNTPDESAQEATGADSLSTGTDIPGTLTPAGTVNPAPSAAGASFDSTSAAGPSQGATPGSANPANAVKSGVASDSSR
jgi:hypothetical protein